LKKSIIVIVILMVSHISKAQSGVGEVASINKKKTTIVFPERERIKTKAQLAKEEELLKKQEALLLEEKQKKQEVLLEQENKVHNVGQVETLPEFLEGKNKLETFLVKNVNANIPIQQNAPNGLYKVVIKFIVNKDGSIGGIKPLTAFGYNMEKEAMRVVAKTNNMWKSATINGKTVHCDNEITISFHIKND
jgi:hypothetical protein